MTSTLSQLGRRYALPQWKFYLTGTIALILTNIIVLEIPQMAKEVINGLAAGLDLSHFTMTAAGIILLGLLQLVIRTASRMLIFWPGRTLEAALKEDLFAHILKIPGIKLIDHTIGDLTSRLNNDVTQLRIFYAFGILQVLNVIFISLFTISKMVAINPSLSMLAIAPMLLMLLITKTMMPRLHQSMKENTEALGRLTSKVSEAFSQTHVIQSMNALEPIMKRIEPENKAIFDSNLKTIWMRTLTWPLMIILIGLSQFATLTWGGKQIIEGNLTVGDIMAFNIYIGMLTFPFASLGIILNVYQRAKPASDRLTGIQKLPAEETSQDLAGLKLNDSAKTILEVRDLSFAWPDGRIAVNQVSFTVNQGERVGVFGTIGSGKSTLFHLITRLQEPQTGDIKLFGKSTSSMTPDEVRSVIGYALQQPLLFSESVRSNMILGLDETSVTEEHLIHAAQTAQILQDIQSLPEAWDTKIGEKGIRLSGGQKQRLALARLVLRPAKMIILDDVLSAVDHETERRLIDSLLKTNAALLIASHRKSILEVCDKVIIMKEGRIVDVGPYKDVKKFMEVPQDPSHQEGRTTP